MNTLGSKEKLNKSSYTIHKMQRASRSMKTIYITSCQKEVTESAPSKILLWFCPVLSRSSVCNVAIPLTHLSSRPKNEAFHMFLFTILHPRLLDKNQESMWVSLVPTTLTSVKWFLYCL